LKRSAHSGWLWPFWALDTRLGEPLTPSLRRVLDFVRVNPVVPLRPLYESRGKTKWRETAASVPAPFKRHPGGYRMNNKFRVLIAVACAARIFCL